MFIRVKSPIALEVKGAHQTFYPGSAQYVDDSVEKAAGFDVFKNSGVLSVVDNPSGSAGKVEAGDAPLGDTPSLNNTGDELADKAATFRPGEIVSERAVDKDYDSKDVMQDGDNTGKLAPVPGDPSSGDGTIVAMTDEDGGVITDEAEAAVTDEELNKPLDQMTKVELYAYADKKHGQQLDRKLNKEDLLKAVKDLEK